MISRDVMPNYVAGQTPITAADLNKMRDEFKRLGKIRAGAGVEISNTACGTIINATPTPKNTIYIGSLDSSPIPPFGVMEVIHVAVIPDHKPFYYVKQTQGVGNTSGDPYHQQNLYGGVYPGGTWWVVNDETEIPALGNKFLELKDPFRVLYDDSEETALDTTMGQTLSPKWNSWKLGPSCGDAFDVMSLGTTDTLTVNGTDYKYLWATKDVQNAYCNVQTYRAEFDGVTGGYVATEPHDQIWHWRFYDQGRGRYFVSKTDRNETGDTGNFFIDTDDDWNKLKFMRGGLYRISFTGYFRGKARDSVDSMSANIRLNVNLTGDGFIGDYAPLPGLAEGETVTVKTVPQYDFDGHHTSDNYEDVVHYVPVAIEIVAPAKPGDCIWVELTNTTGSEYFDLEVHQCNLAVESIR